MDSLALKFAEEWGRRPAFSRVDRSRPQNDDSNLDDLTDSVVLISRADDEHVLAVHEELKKRQIPTVVVDVDATDESRGVTYRPSAESTACRAIYCRTISATQPVAHHNERTLYDTFAESKAGNDTRQFSASERRAGVFGFALSLNAEIAMNDPWVSLRAGQKPVQLSLAEQIGLPTPRTIVTDETHAVIAFSDEIGSPIVYKSLDSPVVWRDGQRAGFLFTSEVTPAHLADMSERLECPGIFQEKLDITTEYRVTVVGERVFAASCMPALEGEVDWRRRLVAGVDFGVASLEPTLESKLLSLVELLGLEFAAIDLASDGETVYLLEVNPDGAYLWLEKSLGIPITSAICDRLSMK